MTKLNINEYLKDTSEFITIENKLFINCYKCSIDKIKILIKSSKSKIQKFADANQLNPYIKHYKSMSLSACKDNWLVSYQEDDNTNQNQFYVGFSPNWYHDNNLACKYIVVEYNPNKVFIQEKLIGYTQLTSESIYVHFMYIDFAYDVEYRLQDLIIYPRHGNEYTAIIGHGGKRETMYFGKFGEDGAVRVYDKAKEQKIKGLTWTRYEIRIKDIDFGNSIQILDKLKFNTIHLQEADLLDITPKEKIIMKAIQENIELLNEFDKKTRKKYKEMLEHSLINVILDNTSAIDAFNNYCLNIF